MLRKFFKIMFLTAVVAFSTSTAWAADYTPASPGAHSGVSGAGNRSISLTLPDLAQIVMDAATYSVDFNDKAMLNVNQSIPVTYDLEFNAEEDHEVVLTFADPDKLDTGLKLSINDAAHSAPILSNRATFADYAGGKIVVKNEVDPGYYANETFSIDVMWVDYKLRVDPASPQTLTVQLNLQPDLDT